MNASQTVAEEPPGTIAARRAQIKAETIPPKPLTIARGFLLASRVVVGVSFGLVSDGGWSEPLRQQLHFKQIQTEQEQILNRIESGEAPVTLRAVRFLYQPNSYVPGNNSAYTQRVTRITEMLFGRAHKGEITLSDGEKADLSAAFLSICGIGGSNLSHAGGSGSGSSHASGGCHACVFEEAANDLLRRKKWERRLAAFLRKTKNPLTWWMAVVARGYPQPP